MGWPFAGWSMGGKEGEKREEVDGQDRRTSEGLGAVQADGCVEQAAIELATDDRASGRPAGTADQGTQQCATDQAEGDPGRTSSGTQDSTSTGTAQGSGCTTSSTTDSTDRSTSSIADAALADAG